jgi:hypothetical protein
LLQNDPQCVGIDHDVELFLEICLQLACRQHWLLAHRRTFSRVAQYLEG